MSKEHAHCCVCRENYVKTELYTCYNNHVFCAHCYKSEFYKGKERRCPKKHCYSWVNASPPIHVSNDRHPKKMFPRPHIVAQKKKVSAQSSIISIYRGKSVTTQLLSRKPVNCPHAGCGKSVAVSAFDAHFSYEHPKVQVIHTYLESRNGMELYLNSLASNAKICIVRLNVLESGDTCSKIQYEANGELLKPSLILLATRLSSAFDTSQNQDYESNSDDSEVSIFPAGDKLLIWLASNIQTNLTYTVAVATACNRIMMKYYGPLVTLDVEPRTLFMEGKGMALAQHQLLGMTNNLKKHLILNVLLHGKY